MTNRMDNLLRNMTALILMALIVGCTTIRPTIDEDADLIAEPVFSHRDFDRVLQRFVDDRGWVDYASLQREPKDIETYYRLLTEISPDSHPDKFPGQDHQLAYWINAYNAAVIKTVLTHYPIDSALDVKTPALFFYLSDKAGFFLFQRVTFGGQTTSLYYLENQVIRKRFDDPRIHFALNCAARGCPRLPRQTFTGEALDRQLDRETRFFLSEARSFKIDHEQKAIYLSSIFTWYEDDFTGWYQRHHPESDSDLLDYVALYLPPRQKETLAAVRGQYALRFIPYDWRLNDQRTFLP